MPSPIRLFQIFLLIALTASLAHSQGIQPTVRGSVKLRGQTVLDQRVEVILLTSDGRPRDRVFTDSLGNFQFLSVGPGQYILVIDHPGYQRIEQQVEITGGLNRTLTQRAFMLEPKAQPTVKTAGLVSVERLRMPKEAQEYFEKGERELAKRNYEKAAENFEKAIETAPEVAEPACQRGIVALQQNEPVKARGFFERAVAIDAAHGEAWIGLGAALSREGRAQDALEPLNRGLSTQPKSYLGLFERCRANLGVGQTEAALADCEAAKQNAEGVRPELMVLQGNLFLRLNRNPEAMREFQNYLKQDNSSPTATAVRDVVDRMKKAGIKPAA